MKRAILLSSSSNSRLLALLSAAALTLGVLMVLWPTLPVQAQSESTYNHTETPQPTGKHLIVFSATNALPTGYERRIADLGGTVEDAYTEIGVVSPAA